MKDKIASEPREASTTFDAGDGFVKVGLFDINGVLRGKYLHQSKVQQAIERGIGLCDAVLCTDVQDQFYDKAEVTGWHTGFPDARIQIDSRLLRQISTEHSTPFYLADFIGQCAPFCSRSILRRTIEKAQAMGFEPFGAMELEFTVFRETLHSASSKHYRNLAPAGSGSNSYSLLQAADNYDIYRPILSFFESFNVPIESLHEETGTGFMEVSFRATDLLSAADHAALFKTFLKALLRQHDLLPTFMAKWREGEQGQSAHIHISLKGSGNGNVFYDKRDEYLMSSTMKHFLGGQQTLMPQVTALFAPTTNAYKRFLPGFWAPTWASWGHENRTVALRRIGDCESDLHLEYRPPGADCNPYLAFAACLATGLWGVENAVTPSAPVTGDAYAIHPDPKLALPTTLREAVARFRDSAEMHKIFGSDLVNYFVTTREKEIELSERAVTDWELNRYFNTI